jgi:LPXTG-site transpeptidase (sortase) family protein
VSDGKYSKISIDFSIKRAIIKLYMEVKNWTQLMDALLLRKISFVIAFFVVFITTYAILFWLDFLPELVDKKASELVAQETTEQLSLPIEEEILTTLNTNNSQTLETANTPVFPISIEIEALDRTIAVLNPTSRINSDLDAALLEGAVRHPDSATLAQSGTVFILAHSSYLPVVRNKNFQAFNGIQNLEWGDTINLTAEDGIYVYRVDKVYRASAQDVVVPIAGPTKRLVLATCNSFGSIDDRYIVEADLIEVKSFN